MKLILYAGGSVLTGDVVAHSVAEYATALAQAGKADTVRIPVIKDGRLNSVELVIGPASQLIIEDAGGDFEDAFHDDTQLGTVLEKLKALRNPEQVQPRPSTAGDDSSLDDL
ncbi:MAG: hypothetical protein H7226_01190 [Salinibacterium sp.]|nr:hypothetical protein [Salinibacterium sp.]